MEGGAGAFFAKELSRISYRMHIEILDTTLRDGAQGCGVEFSPTDRMAVMHRLDELGIPYMEIGMMTGEESAAWFREVAAEPFSVARPVIFSQTCRSGEAAAENTLLRLTAESPIGCVSIFGKSWRYQAQRVLGTTAEENLRMIRESVAYLKAAGKQVFFDAEHFFDGYSDDADYACTAVETAFAAGADRVVLCDTNGGMLPDSIGVAVDGIFARLPEEARERLGIHCHNDMGMAAACTVTAVLSGVRHVQGTISGFGERCGNANLGTVIPVLEWKLGFHCIGETHLARLTPVVRAVNEAANRAMNENEPFVGGYAFTHKAGTHIDGVRKSPRAFEHMDPAVVGNRRNFVVSSQSGRAALLGRMREYLSPADADRLTKNSPELLELWDLLRERESLGYDYEDAEASLALLIAQTLGRRRRFFELRSFKVIVDEDGGRAYNDRWQTDEMKATAAIKIAVGGTEELTAGEGNGPVNAMDVALRRALTRFYPEIAHLRLSDYRVRVLDAGATASVVRVRIESTDGVGIWRTVGVSPDIITASWQALRDSVEYMLSKQEQSEVSI